nr:mucin-2-like isoform X1 [Danio rerio]|eukprot:XP_021326285.1 mucin-2-like isoform X1 [Danio rerio]
MGFDSEGTVRMPQMWMLRWVFLLAGLQSIQAGFMGDYRDMENPMTPMWPTTPAISMTSVPVITVEPNPDHRSTICSTWGNFHFKTFDGHFFQLPDTCNYVLAVMCDAASSDFNIQMQRETVNGSISFSTVLIKLDGTVIKVTDSDITMGEETVTVPTYKNGIKIEGSPTSFKISNKHGVTVFWEEDNSLSIELPEKYQGQTCGLCGDFNGNLADDITDNGPASWKVSISTEICEEVTLPSTGPCDELSEQASFCEEYLISPGFSGCYDVMDMSSFEKACESDLCQCYGNHDCLCNTLTEISQQCTHAGGQPGTWRTEQLCPKTCPLNLLYLECGGPCKSTCSAPTADLMCTDHCVDGCFCPEGMVEDDIGQSGCVPVNKCPCVHNNKTYFSGDSYTQACKTCTCDAGHWTCSYLDCPGICSVVGGSHVTTYDGKTFTFSGNCDYILTKHYNNSDFAVVGNLAPCNPSRTDICLNSVALVLLGTTISFSSNGDVTLNGNSPFNLPAVIGPVSIFQPSSSFIIADLHSIRLEIQLAPIMQLYIVASTEEKGKMTGLCGNYNDVQTDDFKTESGIIEGTPTSFVNFWKQNCPDLEITFDNPCSLNMDTEKLAKDWCSRLTNQSGVFSACHSEICPDIYYQWCVYDTCKCADIRQCMCAALSTYAHACAARGIILQGWMDAEPCETNCPDNMKYSYGVTSCDNTCRSLSGQENTCQGSFTPVHGCVCSEGTYLNEEGKCVHAGMCPCYYGNQVIQPSAEFNKEGAKCTCNNGKLDCSSHEDCVAPMTFFKCSHPGEKGTECQRTCDKQDPNNCVSTGCVSGCMCPEGLLADGNGGCVMRENCPCTHNGVASSPGDQVQQDCNTCTCTNGMWICTQKACYGTCTIYGEGHFRTFDGNRYSFHGDCEHTLAHDYCDGNPSPSFRLVTENIPCATANSICSKSINLFFGRYEMILSEDDGVKVVEGNGTEYKYQINYGGIYVVIEIEGLLNLIWDEKTSVMIQLHPKLKGNVCGLCGNFDGNANNDFMKHNGEVVTDPEEFGISWKVKPDCPDVTNIKDLCTENPHRSVWSEKRCSIIISDVFKDCHTLVDPNQYYDNCKRDTCGCETGGDCDCFCTAVAAYAAECRKKGACVKWRSPNTCPLFCDYYNPPGKCEWHYDSCGPPCPKTCKNPTGTCSDQIPLLEGSTINQPDECYTTYCNSTCNVVQKMKFDNNTIDGCNIKTCKNGKLTLNPVQCDPVVVPKCVNGLQPVKAYYNNGCCFRYECECFCKAYGDPHYRTFDGQYYTFQGNCTYVLMEEIIPTYNISVHLKNYYCDVVKRIACTQYAIVYYNSYKILLNSTNDKVVHVYVNDQLKIPTYITDNFIITTTGIAATVNITDINVQITVSAVDVSVKLPSSYFRKNTKGQCGYCDNSVTNDCQYPNGTFSSSCEKVAAFWNVSQCTPPSTPPVPTVPTVVPPCEILKSDLFKSCRDVVPFKEYYQACKYDVFTMGNKSYACATVESYAQLCGQKSICVDWRSSPELKGLCDFKCPSSKVYKACGPKVEQSCSTSYNTMYADTQCQGDNCNQTSSEGCYCPDGQYRVNMTSNLCTAYCDCIGPDGSPRKPGQIWTYQCYNYTCQNTGVYVKVPVTCPTIKPCGDGYKSSVENCCPTCVCDYEQCLKKKCDVGFELGLNKANGSCCPPCVRKDVCVYNNTEYKVGVYYFTCQTLNCRQVNGSFVAEMTTNPCPYMSSQDCGPGFDYVKKSEDCCGTCVQTKCTYMMDNTTYTLQVGEVQSYKCENVTCSVISGSPVTERNSEKCTYLSSLDCKLGSEYVKKAGDCCGTCVQKNCTYMIGSTTYMLQVGEVHSYKCENVTCSVISGSPVTTRNSEKCTYLSSLDCKLGSEYVKEEGDCCGTCVQRNCTYMVDNTMNTLQVGEVHSYKCENVTCSIISGSPVTERNSEKCTYLSSLDCNLGFEYVIQEGDCCGTCVQRNCTYMVDETTHTLQVGEVHSYKCENVTCSLISGSPVTERNSEKCTYLSSLDCKPCFEYVKQEDECCGTCKQTCCVYEAPDNTTHTLQSGEAYTSKCETGTCHEVNGLFETEKKVKECPPFNADDCDPGTIKLDSDQCCYTCETRNCVRQINITRLQVKDCTSVQNVEIPSCTGHCGSMYSLYTNQMTSCSCCQKDKSTSLPVKLKCTNGTEIDYNYTYIQSCKCTPMKCADKL